MPWQQLVTFGPQEFRTYARLRFLPDPTFPGQDEPVLGADARDEYDLLRIALDVLSEHTHAPEDLFFCMWDGWGTPPALQPMAMVTIPERSYFLFEGEPADFDDWDSARMAGVPSGYAVPPPAFVWPADRAWCIARDVDAHYAGIGASAEAIDQLVTHTALDVVPADPTEEQPHYL